MTCFVTYVYGIRYIYDISYVSGSPAQAGVWAAFTACPPVLSVRISARYSDGSLALAWIFKRSGPVCSQKCKAESDFYDLCFKKSKKCNFCGNMHLKPKKCSNCEACFICLQCYDKKQIKL